MSLKIGEKFHILKRLKFRLYMHEGLTRVPTEDSVISDLFPIRPVDEWTTDFELLNLDELALGNSKSSENPPVLIYFFDQLGKVTGKREVFHTNAARLTVRISDYLKEELENSSSFSVFHQCPTSSLNQSGSFLAERGYCGYSYKGSLMKGYVHGNLDAIAYKNGSISPIGNYGLFYREYIVQHPLMGPAKYELILTNPTNLKIKVTPYFQMRKGYWEKLEAISLSPLGSHTFKFTVKPGEKSLIKFRSRLYLCRPVVFRINQESIDVFHG